MPNRTLTRTTICRRCVLPSFIGPFIPENISTPEFYVPARKFHSSAEAGSSGHVCIVDGLRARPAGRPLTNQATSTLCLLRPRCAVSFHLTPGLCSKRKAFRKASPRHSRSNAEPYPAQPSRSKGNFQYTYPQKERRFRSFLSIPKAYVPRVHTILPE